MSNLKEDYFKLKRRRGDLTSEKIPMLLEDTEQRNLALENTELILDLMRKNPDIELSRVSPLELEIPNTGIEPKDMLMIEHTDGTKEMYEKSTTTITEDQIEQLSQRTGLERNDIILLMSEGLELEEIDQKVQILPFKEISDSSAIREMVKRDIDEQALALIQEKGLTIEELETGDLQVTQIKKMMEVNELGLVELTPEYQKKLEPLEQFKLLAISKGLTIQEVEESELEQQELDKTQKEKYKIVELDEKRREHTKEELEKEEMAQKIGVDPSEIISVIRIEDREGGSKLFNDSLTQNAKPVIVRLRNNNFKIMEELDSGEMNELQGFEATPAAKHLASLIKDTSHKGDSYILPGEIRAGKTNPNQERYDVFLVRAAGESKDNDSSTLMYVGYSGNVAVDVVEKRGTGSSQLVEVPFERDYPGKLYIESSNGAPKKQETTQDIEKDPRKEVTQPKLEYNELSKKAELLRRLAIIDRKIAAKEHLEAETEKKTPEKGQIDKETELPVHEESMEQLKSERSSIIRKLGMEESQSRDYEEDILHVKGPRQK